MARCPCGKTRPVDQCCGRFIFANQIAKTPEQLMRSRYTAYALGDCGEYLLQTWFPATAKGLSAARLSERVHHWDNLQILTKTQHGDEGSVEFKAFYHLPDGTLNFLHELSEFKRVQGRWYYVGGRVS